MQCVYTHTIEECETVSIVSYIKPILKVIVINLWVDMSRISWVSHVLIVSFSKVFIHRASYKKKKTMCNTGEAGIQIYWNAIGIGLGTQEPICQLWLSRAGPLEMVR